MIFFIFLLSLPLFFQFLFFTHLSLPLTVSPSESLQLQPPHPTRTPHSGRGFIHHLKNRPGFPPQSLLLALLPLLFGQNHETL